MGTRLRKTFFGNDGIKGYYNTEINLRFASCLGAAYGTELKGEVGFVLVQIIIMLV